MEMEAEKHLSDLLNEFKTGMLITRGQAGLHARPMTIAGLSSAPEIYLVSSIDTPKVQEIEANPKVLLTFQANQQFVSLEGQARISRDRAVIDKLWSETWRVWFPEGRMIRTSAFSRSRRQAASIGTTPVPTVFAT
jgi:general stress protein 26